MKLGLFGGRLTSTLALYYLTRENVLTADHSHPTFSIQTGEQCSRFKNLFDMDYFETSTFADPDAGISPGGPFSVFGTVTARY